MKPSRTSLVVSALAWSLLAAPGGAQQDEGPRLIVMVTVDQLRADLLDRYAPAFTGGFARLAREGRSYRSASHAHAVTHTAAGHATLSTGVVPARSGIVANTWTQRVGGEWKVGMYAVQDSTSPIIGHPEAAGRSPRNLLREGLADWVLKANPDARVVSLSSKDRAAITMAGKSRGHVYWLLSGVGRFVTSAYYRDAYPDWVREFNQTVIPRILADTVWESTVPEEFRRLARDDEGVPFEGDGAHTTFPHVASAETVPGDSARYIGWAMSQPRQDRAVFELAKVAVKELRLGRRGPVDFLSMSFSATDYVGHGYGPLSQEQLDNLVRLDRELGELFSFLDETVGEGRWVLGLSADHGVMDMPEALAGEGEAGRRSEAGARQRAVSSALQAAADAVGVDSPVFADTLAAILENRGLVAQAYTHRELVAGEPADSFAILFRNSYHPGRGAGWLSRFGVEMRFGYNELVSGPTGTSHGSPYWYDRHVPLILFGPGVPAGSSTEAVYTVDMAPTLAALAGIPAPSDLDGKPLVR